MSDKFKEIINSYYNGQFIQMIEQINDLGWDEFIEKLNDDEALLIQRKYQILRAAVRMDKSTRG